MLRSEQRGLTNSFSVNRTSTHTNAVVEISFPMNRIASTWQRCSSMGLCSGLFICLLCWMAASHPAEQQQMSKTNW